MGMGKEERSVDEVKLDVKGQIEVVKLPGWF